MKKIIFTFISFLCCSKVNALNIYVLDTYAKIDCGETTLPLLIAQITRTIIIVLQIVVPIIIIILGMFDLVKGLTSQKEEEIKKGQQIFIKRVGIGISIFLVFFIVEIVIGFVKPKNENIEMWNCVNCFINGQCEEITIDN